MKWGGAVLIFLHTGERDAWSVCKEKRLRVPDASQPRPSVKGARFPTGPRTGSFLLNSQNSRFQNKRRTRQEEVKGIEWRRKPQFFGTRKLSAVGNSRRKSNPSAAARRLYATSIRKILAAAGMLFNPGAAV